VQVGVLGEFQVRMDAESQWLTAPSAQVARLGSILTCWPMQVVEDQVLIRALWGDQPPRTAGNTLQVHVSRLRALLGAPQAVLRRSHGYLLDVRPADVDAEMFEGLLSAARGHCQMDEFAQAEDLVRQCLVLWRGTPFLGVDEPEVAARRARLEEQRMIARELATACRIRLAGDDYARDLAVADAQGLFALAPDRPRSRELLAEALDLAGRQSQARQVRQGSAMSREEGLREGALGA